MSEQTAISWCDSTFNPWIGCTHVSPACDNCYAEALADTRLHRAKWGPHQQRARTSAANWRQPLLWEKEHEAFGLMHGRRRRVFCASLADVFDNEVPPAWRQDLFALIENTPHLDWLLLTKRIGNAAKMMFAARGGHLPLLQNVWLGATVVNQAEADRDVPKLLATPAALRFLSIEPMLGFVDLKAQITQLDWVICGGESGTAARPMHPGWARSLRDQCASARVPFHFKQWGEWAPRGPESMGYPLVDSVPRVRLTDAGHNGQNLAAKGGNDCWMQRAGKAYTGRQLDGVEHDGWPV